MCYFVCFWGCLFVCLLFAFTVACCLKDDVVDSCLFVVLSLVGGLFVVCLLVGVIIVVGVFGFILTFQQTNLKKRRQMKFQETTNNKPQTP